jgi:hypothetical protein
MPRRRTAKSLRFESTAESWFRGAHWSDCYPANSDPASLRRAVAIINPDGLFGGDRLRHCSNAAQLHWPRFFLASDGFGRLELNYHKITATAYTSFNPVPSEQELWSYVKEYIENFLLFPYSFEGQAWGQWDTLPEYLPRYKRASDRRSPVPPELDFSEWKRRYRTESKTLPKCFGNFPETFLHGVGVEKGLGLSREGKTPCASASDARDGDAGSPLSFSLFQPDAQRTDPREAWWEAFWSAYSKLRNRDKKRARTAFLRAVTNQAVFEQVMGALDQQTPEMTRRSPEHRPHASTWLNARRWEDGDGEAPKVGGESTVMAEVLRRIEEKEKTA